MICSVYLSSSGCGGYSGKDMDGSICRLIWAIGVWVAEEAVDCLFASLIVFFHWQRAFHFMQFYLLIHRTRFCTIGLLFRKVLPILAFWREFPEFSSRSILGFIFWDSFLLFLNYVHVHMSARAYWGYWHWIPWSVITSSCELPSMNAENWTWKTCKRVCSLKCEHISIALNLIWFL